LTTGKKESVLKTVGKKIIEVFVELSTQLICLSVVFSRTVKEKPIV
jgi:hypothetical protein